MDNPCNESWTSMTTIEKGKYCSACSKSVIDFTSLTDTEILRLIEKARGKVCGRLDNKQLNRIIEIQGKQNIGTGIYKLLTGLIFLSTTNNLDAKNVDLKRIERFKTEFLQKSNDSIILNDTLTLPTDSLKSIIKGTVIDNETKEPLAGATIQLKGKPFGTTTDINGIFKLNIREEFLSEKMIFQVFYVGFETNEFTVNKNDLPIDKELLILPSQTALLGEVVIIKQNRKWWQRKRKSCH
jgi:hypothetical protein